MGEDVHLAARVAAASHGGQIVLSRATAGLVDASLAGLGEHRLKDIPQPVAIYQLGSQRFPPLRTISNTNLPRPASSFVGRERGVSEVIVGLEQGGRLLTLTGPGGSGKTRLAIEAATSLVPAFKAGVFWVGLASLRDPLLVTETIAHTLGAKDGLATHIGQRELLLLLDNLEQVVDAAPDLSALLSDCPNLTLLCTSRELLRVQGEVEYPVPPLAQPEAVSLFCERSQLEPTQSIAELCSRLDSLPLAVELAAARTRALTPSQILERLSERLDLLKGGRDADPRQQTLRATIAWSHDLLAAQEQNLFAALSVFAGGCSLEAAEHVARADLDTLQSLVDKSLVRFSRGRYWMLETIREFALERLEAGAEGAELGRRHACHYLALAEAAKPHLRAAEQTYWLRREQEEHGNFRAALSWTGEHGDSATLLRLTALLYDFWAVRGYYSKGRAWLEQALAATRADVTTVRVEALQALADLTHAQGDIEQAARINEEGLRAARQLDDRRLVAESLHGGGQIAVSAGEYHRARSLYNESLMLMQELGENAGGTVSNLADLALIEGDYDEAIVVGAQALSLQREYATPEAL